MYTLNNCLKQIESVDLEMAAHVRARVDQLIKPQGSMGTIEEIAVRLSGIMRTPFPRIEHTAVIVMCGDHGVCEEHVASAPQPVTLMQAINMTKGLTGIGALTKAFGSRLYTVDIGINSEKVPYDAIINRKIKYGTANMTQTAAMTRTEAIKALEVGIEMAHTAVENGAHLLGTGEMGIGNTTPSTAILSVLTGESPEVLTGMGANFPEHLIPHKAQVIKRALLRNTPDPSDALDVLSKVGGLDIAGMAGVMLGGAQLKVPVIIDGYISTVAALVACALEPKVKEYLFASHVSLEKGAALATERLGLKPFLDLNMRLGEGSGAIMAFNAFQAACAMNAHMITFEEAGFGVV